MKECAAYPGNLSIAAPYIKESVFEDPTLFIVHFDTKSHVNPAPVHPPTLLVKDKSSDPSAPVPESTGGVADTTEVSMRELGREFALVEKLPTFPVVAFTAANSILLKLFAAVPSDEPPTA